MGNILEAMMRAQLFIERFGKRFIRLKIGGSVRRRSLEPKDIEFIGICDERAELIADIDKCVWCHPASEIQEYYQPIKPGTNDVVPWPLKPDGKYWRLVEARKKVVGSSILGYKIDLFLAEPDNFGLIYLIRTGSADFSKMMLARWKEVSGGGYSENGYLHTREGEKLLTPTEADVFKLLKLPVLE